MSSRPRVISVLPLLTAVALLPFRFGDVIIGAVQGTGNLDARLPQPIGAPPAVSRTPPGRGAIFDADALERTKTFCVDLNTWEAPRQPR
jgi:hypothetical protein